MDIGIHCHNYPLGYDGAAPSPAPTGLAYTSVRTHDGGVQWRDLNPARGVYNWTRLDAIIAAHPGKSIVLTLYGTPAFAVLHQSDLTLVDNWGSPGGAAAANQSDVQTFVTAALIHCKGKLKAVEIWNEPQFKGYVRDSFFWGTAAELVSMGLGARLAINTVDQTVESWSPGFDSLAAMTEWLSAGMMTKGRDIIDAVAFHRYGFWQSLSDLNIITDSFGVQVIRKLMAANGISNKKLVLSECGLGPNMNDSRNVAFAALSSDARRSYITGFLMMLRGAGVSGAYLYAWDEALFGDLIGDTLGVRKAVNDFGGLTAPAA